MDVQHLSDRLPSKEVRDLLRIKDTSTVMRQTRLRWFGHVERMDNENLVGKCISLETDGSAGRGIPRKTWNQVVQCDLLALHFEKGFAEDRMHGKKSSRIYCTTHASMEKDITL